MTEPHLSLRVDAVEPRGKFAWVIVELRPRDEDVELAVSMTTYDKPSDAMRAGEQLLAAMYPLPAMPLAAPP